MNRRVGTLRQSADGAARAEVPEHVGNVARTTSPLIARIRGATDLVGTTRLALMALWVAGATFVGLQLNRGWVPLDDGTLAHSAQRVLDGELPHRDFAELYTGGLTFLNAGVVSLLGEDLIWLRLPLFVLFVAYIPCVYLIARRFAGRRVSALVAAFAVAWGLPAYPAAMPSWYLLVFATAGVLALLKHRETNRIAWLVAAGVLGGLAVATKVNAVFYVIAAVLYLIVVEQESRPEASRRLGRSLYGMLAIAASLLPVLLVIAVVRSHFGPAEVFNFVVPVAAVCYLVAHNERAISVSGSRERLITVLRLTGPFLLGVTAPLLLLLAPYAATGSVGDLLTGTLVTPQARLQDARHAYYSTPSPASLVILLPVLAVVAARRYTSTRTWLRLDRVATVCVALALVASGTVIGYKTLWIAARALAPTVVVLGVIVLIARRHMQGQSRRPEVFLLLAMAAFLSLVQFPFGAPIYLCFLAPLVVLAALAALRYSGVSTGLLPVALLGAFVLFGFVWIDRGAVYRFGLTPAANPHTMIFDDRRASIRVAPSERAVYRRAIALIERHSTGGYIFAGPDTPEFYALTSLRNPTRSLFDWLDPTDSARGENLLRALRGRDIRAIVINVDPPFSDPLASGTLAQLRVDYPRHERVGTFEVRWRTQAFE